MMLASIEGRRSVRFVFEERKSAQAAARLLVAHGGSMPYIKLIKLLYLADRESLIGSGYPITGARLVSMDKGPVLSEVLDLMTREQDGESAWHRYVSHPDRFEVSLDAAPEADELSEYEIAILDGVFDRFGRMDRWDLVRHTHTLPEWADPGGSSLDIDVRVILREAGRSDEEIRAIFEQAEAMRAFRAAYSAA